MTLKTTNPIDPFATQIPPVPAEAKHDLPTTVWREKAYKAMELKEWGNAYWYWIYATETCREEGIRLTYLGFATDALDRWRNRA